MVRMQKTPKALPESAKEGGERGESFRKENAIRFLRQVQRRCPKGDLGERCRVRK